MAAAPGFLMDLLGNDVEEVRECMRMLRRSLSEAAICKPSEELQVIHDAWLQGDQAKVLAGREVVKLST